MIVLPCRTRTPELGNFSAASVSRRAPRLASPEVANCGQYWVVPLRGGRRSGNREALNTAINVVEETVMAVNQDNHSGKSSAPSAPRVSGNELEQQGPCPTPRSGSGAPNAGSRGLLTSPRLGWLVKRGNLGGTEAPVASARSTAVSSADASQFSTEDSAYGVSACQPVSLEASCHNFMAARDTGENSENAPAGRVSITGHSRRPPLSAEAALSASKRAVGGSAETCPFVFDRAFLTHLEHELRTPIATAIGFMEIIKELIPHGEPDHELNEFCERASLNCEKMLNRIDQLICYTHLENDRQEILLNSTDLDDILERSRLVCESEAIQKGLEFKFAPLHAGRMVFSNSDRLLQILNIVVQNAIKFTNCGSVVITTSEFVCGESQEVFIDISVSDTGIGFDVHEHDAIFVPFKQLDSGTSRKFSGLGLGLAIAKRAADLIGALIHVESSKLQGSRFTIRVPTARTIASL